MFKGGVLKPGHNVRQTGHYQDQFISGDNAQLVTEGPDELGVLRQ